MGDEDGEEPSPTDDLAPVALPIESVLDLHSFPPREVRDLVRDWLDAAYQQGLRDQVDRAKRRW